MTDLLELPIVEIGDLQESSLPDDVDLSYLDHPSAKYSKETKVKAVGVFFETGSVRKTAEALSLPYNIVDYWKKSSPWFEEIIGQLRKQKQKELDVLLTNTIHKSLIHVNDRLDNGDSVYDARRGEMKQVPMKGKDVAITLSILYDKRALIRGEATSIKQESKATLQSLEDKFKSFALQLKEKDVIAQQ